MMDADVTEREATTALEPSEDLSCGFAGGRHQLPALAARSEPPAGRAADFATRMVVAGAGVAAAWHGQGFRYQAAGALAMLTTLVVLRPDPVWWALALFGSLLLLALELVNSALETLADLVQPHCDRRVKQLKDMAAAAVVVASLGVLVIGVLMILHAAGLAA